MVKSLFRVIPISLILLLLSGSMSAFARNLANFPVPDLSQEDLPAECYGILTDEYSIFYTQDETGAVTMGQDSLADLQSLLQDEQEMQKVIQDKAVAQGKSVTCFEVTQTISRVKKELRPALALQSVTNLPSVQLPAPMSDTVATLHNFTQQLSSERCDEATSTSPGYSRTHIKRRLGYVWNWDYTPLWTLTDTVGITWSQEMRARFGDDEVLFVYMVRGRQELPVNSPVTALTALESSTGDNAYSREIDTDRGLQKNYDIRSKFKYNGKDYVTTSHLGLFSVIVVAENSDLKNIPITYNGRYYHKMISVVPNITLGKDLSLSLGYAVSYAAPSTISRGFYFFDA